MNLKIACTEWRAYVSTHTHTLANRNPVHILSRQKVACGTVSVWTKCRLKKQTNSSIKNILNYYVISDIRILLFGIYRAWSIY